MDAVKKFKKATRYPHKRSDGLRRTAASERLIKDEVRCLICSTPVEWPHLTCTRCLNEDETAARARIYEVYKRPD